MLNLIAFKPSDRQDSHKALRCIFDALRDEELQVCSYTLLNFISQNVCTYICITTISVENH